MTNLELLTCLLDWKHILAWIFTYNTQFIIIIYFYFSTLEGLFKTLLNSIQMPCILWLLPCQIVFPFYVI